MHDDERTCVPPRRLACLRGHDEVCDPQHSSFKPIWSHIIALGTIIVVSYVSFATIILAFLFFERRFSSDAPLIPSPCVFWQPHFFGVLQQ